MSLFNLFGNDMDEGLEEYAKTPGAVLLDVREPDEFSSGHIPGAINLPLGQVPSIRYGKDTPLFVYCLSGARSTRAVKWLSANGYTVTNLGGISGYKGPME